GSAPWRLAAPGAAKFPRRVAQPCVVEVGRAGQGEVRAQEVPRWFKFEPPAMRGGTLAAACGGRCVVGKIPRWFKLEPSGIGRSKDWTGREPGGSERRPAWPRPTVNQPTVPVGRPHDPPPRLTYPYPLS